MPTVSTVLVAKAVDAVVALAGTIPKTGLLSDLVVCDGPAQIEVGQVALWIGATDPADPSDVESASAQRAYATLGRSPNTPRDERSVIPCVACAWSGDEGDFSAMRLTCAAIVDALVDAIATAPQSPWLGVPGLLYGQVDTVSILQTNSRNGSEVYLPFTISYRARG